MEYYTYLHRRNDTGAVFYIGKGSGKRYLSNKRRNKHWCGIVDRHGFTGSIVAYWATEAEAFEHERFLIACFKDLDTELANKAEGGLGGCKGISPWNKGLTGIKGTPKTDKEKQLLSKQRTGSGNPMFGRSPWNKGLKNDPRLYTEKQITARKKRLEAAVVANTGAKRSEESKQKMREAWARRKLRQ